MGWGHTFLYVSSYTCKKSMIASLKCSDELAPPPFEGSRAYLFAPDGRSSILELCYLVVLDIICVNLPAKMLLKIDTVWAFIKIVSIPDEELFYETTAGCMATYFVKILRCSRWFCKSPSFEASIFLYLQSQKGSCCSISDDLSCSSSWFAGFVQHV